MTTRITSHQPEKNPGQVPSYGWTCPSRLSARQLHNSCCVSFRDADVSTRKPFPPLSGLETNTFYFTCRSRNPRVKQGCAILQCNGQKERAKSQPAGDVTHDSKHALAISRNGARSGDLRCHTVPCHGTVLHRHPLHRTSSNFEVPWQEPLFHETARCEMMHISHFFQLIRGGVPERKSCAATVKYGILTDSALVDRDRVQERRQSRALG